MGSPRRRRAALRLGTSSACAWLLACTAPPGGTGSEGSSSDTGEQGEDLRPSWHQDVAPIVHGHCASCHVQGGFGPFELGSYEQAAQWADPIAEAVEAQTMPPWGAHDTPECQIEHAWVGDLRLSEQERATIVDWVAAGAPEGDPAQAAPLPEPEAASLGEPNAIYSLPSPLTVEGNDDVYVCVSLDLGLDQEVWLTGAELLPDNEAILHHAITMLDTSGASAELAGSDGVYPCAALHDVNYFFSNYFPGSGPTLMPEGVGAALPPEGRLLISFHYHPSPSAPNVDDSRIALRWTTTEPEYEAVITAVGNAQTAAEGLHFGPDDPNGIPTFLIPAGASAHAETMSAVFPEQLPEAELFMLTPHMHHIGVDFMVSLEREGQRSCLIQNPRWDFDWQLVYGTDGEAAPRPTVRGGDRIELRCTYDNSLGNPAMVEQMVAAGLDEPIDVYYGDGGLSEMCMLIYGVALPPGWDEPQP